MSAVASSRSTGGGSASGSSVKSESAIHSRALGVKGGDRQTTRSKLRYGCFLPDLTGLARPPPIADLRLLYRVAARWAQAGRPIEPPRTPRTRKARRRSAECVAGRLAVRGARLRVLGVLGDLSEC